MKYTYDDLVLSNTLFKEYLIKWWSVSEIYEIS